MIKNKKYRNYEKTENAIKDALIKLSLEGNRAKKVSVKDLCAVANISKSTFYLHYADIESIFESVGNKFLITFQEMFAEIINNDTTDFSLYINQIIDFIDESNDIIKIGLSLGKPLNYYVDEIKSQLEQAVISSHMFKDIKMNINQVIVEVKIVASGIIDFIIDLLRNENTAKLKEYSPQINLFLNRWMKGFM